MKMLKLRYGSARRWPRRISRWLPRATVGIEVEFKSLVAGFLFRPFKMIVLVSVHRRIDGELRKTWSIPQEVLHMKKVTIGGVNPEGGPPCLADQTTTMWLKFPFLMNHISVTRYEDGSARRPGWFTVKTMGAQWIVQVKDPDACAQLQVGALLIDEALTMVELLLGSDAAPWEPDAFLRKMLPSGKKGS